VACLSCRPDQLTEKWSESLEAAAILVPATGDLYLAARGLGATLNGSPLVPGRAGTLADALVCVGVRARDGDLAFCLRMVGSFAAEAQKVRCLGHVAGELALLAAGRLDAVVVTGTNLWDFCAGALIAREAGATLSACPAPTRGWLLTAAHAGIFAEVSAIVTAR
jgi:myo-inositol-1(or 4)-monophosphatase